MRSSGSTRSRSANATVRRWVFVIGDDDPKLCTGRRMLRRGLAAAVPSGASSLRPIVLDPYAPEPLSRGDRRRAEHDGVLVVDGSWNRLSARGRLGASGAPAVGRGVPRRLPMLVAANPQHYGRLGELNSAEALAAALFVIGRASEATELLSTFPGGRAFFSVNADRLAAYGRATTAEGIRRAERRLFS